MSDEPGSNVSSLPDRKGLVMPFAVAIALALCGASLALGVPHWASVVRAVRPSAPQLVLFAVAAAMLFNVALRMIPGRSTAQPLRWWLIRLGLVLTVAVTWGVTVSLLDQADQAADAAAARIEAIKTGLGTGAGLGAAFALLLAARKQWHQELAAAEVNHDAVERRITDQFTRAADQLGSDHAPVRLAALYSLERLGQITEAQQEIVLNVLCAYLRMPMPIQGIEFAEPKFEQEVQVRITCQEILARHRRPDAPGELWNSSTINLAGAWLASADFQNVDLGGANLRGADLTGGDLRGANLVGADLTDTILP
jgi:hypothetical protein